LLFVTIFIRIYVEYITLYIRISVAKTYAAKTIFKRSISLTKVIDMPPAILFNYTYSEL